ncbi:MAG TPA: DUF4192 domain-containing protein [Nocardioides sp.]|jgi:hypothetical protein|nr:DUF4192 domain-containing protein [uncultured Nocardioides sp.]HEX5985815.1 DUF4192 domain-containing protein [Nocardioides sp.]
MSAPVSRTIRATSPTDLLAMVPYLLGFHPDRSVVMLTLGRARTPVHARQDLPDGLDDPEELSALVAELVGVARRSGVSRVAVVAYSDDPAVADPVSRALVEALVAAGIDVAVALRADGRRWHCLPDEAGRCDCPRPCPPGGTPYDLTRHPLTLEAVVEGRVVHPSRDALRESLLAYDLLEVQRVAAAVEMAGDRLVAACESPFDRTAPLDPARGRAYLVAEGRWVQHRVRRFIADGLRLDDHDVGRLLVAVAAIEVRDVAWAEISHDDAPRHVDLWRDVVRRAPWETRAAPACLLAFAAWLSGDGALASCALDLCQDAEPGYSMAGVLTQALAAGLPPDSWRPMPRDALTLFRDGA